MPKFKTLIMFMLVIALSFSLIGCGLLVSRSTDLEEVTGQNGDLPEWLLLAHRNSEASSGDRNGEIIKPKELDEDEDDDIAVEPADQDSTQTQAASVPTSSGTTSTAPSSEEQKSSNGKEPKPGTKEYLVWLHEQGKKADDSGDAENEEEEGSFFEGWKNNSPSGLDN